MALTKHASKDVENVVKAVGGKIVFDLLYLPSEAARLSGFETLRSIVYWSAEQLNKAIPNQVVEIMLWLRDHFGPETARRAATLKYRGDPAVAEMGRRENALACLALSEGAIKELSAVLYRAYSRKMNGGVEMDYETQCPGGQKSVLMEMASDALSHLYGAGPSALLAQDSSPAQEASGTSPASDSSSKPA